MTILQLLQQELEQEGQTTRKMLACVPDGKYQWQPHEKSMTVDRLTAHIGELPSWIGMALNTSELDFANNPYQAEKITNTKQLLEYFERMLEDGRKELAAAKEEQLWEMWTLRNGEEIYSTTTKYEVIRMAFCQIIHHRAQLGVYLRLMNVPIPGSYGPSADEMNF